MCFMHPRGMQINPGRSLHISATLERQFREYLNAATAVLERKMNCTQNFVQAHDPAMANPTANLDRPYGGRCLDTADGDGNHLPQTGIAVGPAGYHPPNGLSRSSRLRRWLLHHQDGKERASGSRNQ